MNIDVLLRKLYKYGIRGLLFELLALYLRNRKQYVSIKSAMSPVRILNIGVPQGFVLGPLLFLLYVNEIPLLSDKFVPTMFADDCTLSFSSCNLDYLIMQCNAELEKFKSWSDANRLTLNFDKTVNLMISNVYNTLPRNSVLVDNHIISDVSESKFLGVIIDNKVKFDRHLQYISSKVSKSIGVLYFSRKFIPLSCLKSLYFSFIHPYFLYCLPIFGTTYQTHLNPLILLQKRAIRIISGAEYLDHTDPLFFYNKILKIEDMYKHSIACYTYSHPEILVNFERTHPYYTRNYDSLLTPFMRLRSTQQSVRYNAVQIWNEIPDEIKNSISKQSFKFKYKRYLLSQYDL